MTSIGVFGICSVYAAFYFHEQVALMPGVSKTAQALRFFAQQYGQPGIERKRLVKLLYMADVLGRQYLGHPITNFEYISDRFGPNARELPSAVQELEDQELAEQYETREGVFRRIRLRAFPKPPVFEFTLGENEILRYVVDNYLSMDLEEFIVDVVKETEPYLAAERVGDILRMEMVDRKKRDEIGFDLEEILKAEQQAAEGDAMTLVEFMNELRTDFSPRHTA